MCYYFNVIIKIEDFDFDNILLDEKTYENVLIYVISYNTLIDAKPPILGLIKQKDLLEFMMEFLVLFGHEKMIPFTVG